MYCLLLMLGIPLMVRHLVHLLTLTAAVLTVLGSPAVAQVRFDITGPGVNPDDFRVTEFATGLNYPIGMASLDDGSVLVAVSNGSSFFSSSSGSLVRLADTTGDGVADVQETLVNNVPGGGLSALRRAGDLFLTTGQGRNKPISIYRAGATPSDPLTMVGRIDINYPSGGWLHPHSALAVRETPGKADSYDIFFQLGSDSNFAVTTRTAQLTSDIGVAGTLAGDAIHMLTIEDTPGGVVGSNLQQIATGLRNAAGMAFHPVTGDLYLQDNGIDGFVTAIEPESADELNIIPRDQIGGDIEDFGFPFNYDKYRTGEKVGGNGIQPLVAFQPIPMPDGAEGEGPNDIAFAPANFPAGLNNGVFVGMHGQFSRGGLANEENPLVFADLTDNSYFHFIANNERFVGHLDGLLSTSDSLFAADVSIGGGFSSGNTGRIYQIQSLVPEPATGTLILIGAFTLFGVGRRRQGSV